MEGEGAQETNQQVVACEPGTGEGGGGAQGAEKQGGPADVSM